MNIDGSDIITQYVSKFEKGIPNSVYNKCIREMAQVNLARIEEREVKQIIEEYLYVWGKMGRVVGQNINWQSDLTKTIRQKAKILETFRSYKLENEALNTHEIEIKECYESFQTILWQVAATKVLHLLSPDLFPPWDNDIAEGYRRVVSKDQHVERFSSDDYFRFMKWVQEFIVNNSKILSELAVIYGKTKVRISDECFLYAVRNPFSLIL